MVLETGSLVDRYTVVGPLGEGGMSVVYKVRHNQLGSLHALKVLTLSSPGLRQRLLLEGQVQASLRHPNIVPVTDVIDVNGAPGLVMEYVEGPDLHSMLRAHPLTFEQTDVLARDIIGAVAAAHAKGLVHRDLKPANILLMVVDDRLVPKIMDFGLAKVLVGNGTTSAHTRTGAMMGTPYYMAPEQVRDSKNVGAQADVFSLGAILYEMLTRRRAFEGEDVYEIFGSVAEGRYVRPRELVPDIPDRMEAAIVAALQVDQAARCRDCYELLARWNGELGADGIPLKRTSPWSGEILRDAHALSTGARSAPDEPSQPRSDPTFGGTFEPREAREAPRPPPSARSGSGASLPPPRALALGVLVGGGGAVLAGAGLVLVLVLAGWAAWMWVVPGPAPVAKVVPVAPVATPAVIAPVPDVVAEPVPAGPRPTPGAPPSPEPEAVVAEPEPTAEPEEVEAPAPEPPSPVSTSLPADLDPATTRPGRREETLLQVYRHQPGATAVVVQVLKTDPNIDVRNIAGSVLKGRWREGMDPAGHQAGATWCAKSATPIGLRAMCLRLLGELGDARAPAVLKSCMTDVSPDVREGAIDGCKRWAERFPAQAAEVAGCAPTPKGSLRDQVEGAIEQIKGDD